MFAFACLALPASGDETSNRAASATFAEEVSVHRVQVDVSVIDPKRNDHASVPALPRDAFRIRIDGQDLGPDRLARVEFDEICPREVLRGGESRREGPAPASLPVMIILADLNFLDLGMRHAVAEAVDDLANIARDRPVRAKVLAFDRRVIDLSGGFTSDPSVLSAAAKTLRTLRAPAPPSDDDTRITEGRRDITPEAEILERGRPGDEDDRSRPLIDQDRQRAFELSSRGLVRDPRDGEIIDLTTSPNFLLSTRSIDPRPSLSAIESVLLSHGSIRGRKAMILFSSARFDLPDELWIDYLGGARLAAQEGFALWTVDAAGIGNATSSDRSEMLDFLAYSTGGESVTRGARLSIAFERAWDQQSCYYLFSIPFPEDDRRRTHNIDISLDAAKYPEFWSYRLRAVESIEILDREARTTRARLGALVSPETHVFPEVRISATYPESERRLSRVSVSAVLADLFFRPLGDGRFEARFAIEGVLSDRFGTPLCRIGDGRERAVRVDSPPDRHPPSLVTIETACPLENPGRYEARAVVQDLLTGDLGAASLRLAVADPRRVVPGVSALRLGRNSGRDFIVGGRLSSQERVPRDRARRAFVPVAANDRLVTDDRLMVRFVVCGDLDPPWAIGYERPDPESATGGPDEPRAAFRVALSPLGRADDEAVCREYEGVIPEGSLAEGAYGIALVPRAEQTRSREDLDRHLSEGRVLDTLEFEVAEPPQRKPGRPEGADSEIAQIGEFGERIAGETLVR